MNPEPTPTLPADRAGAGSPTPALDLTAVLRLLRRRADLSQRDLAARSGVPPSTAGDIESGVSPNPGIRTVERLVAATGARLAVVDIDGSEPVAPPSSGWYDGAGRRFPAHLDPRPAIWRGIGPVTGYEFIRNRQRRDWLRRCAVGARRGELTCEIRRLGPGDAATLATLTNAPPSDEDALRYLRDPGVRHWVAEAPGALDAWLRGPLLGHLVAHVHRRHADPPTMVVTEIGVRAAHRDGPVGGMLVAAMRDEAARLGAGDIVAMPNGRSTARFLRGLGFRKRPRRAPLLSLGG